ncbi:MAG: sulfotransferase family protein [Neoaquamicrobium sediminum]|uniref:sulfotransferase family protein n=2 Tax=Neoaquamicrobium sediminum TaxID=1849104 RepID=UPI001D295EB5|nr:sulfotransferase [Mesorhizobium sp.]
MPANAISRLHRRCDERGNRSRMPRPKIDFFVIGAARCGTTSLYRVMQDHPGIFVPEMKEPRFFKENRNKGWAWYAAHYADAPANTLSGDLSPNYAASVGNSVAHRIHSAYPDAKIIYLVRNPIDCAISNWRMSADVSGVPVPFAEALDTWRLAVVERALFWRQLSYFREFYPDEQIKVASLEKLRSSPEELDSIFSFLGTDSADAVFPRANASDWKPGRPGKPDVDHATREHFIDLVADDAKALLSYAALPQELWTLTPGYKGWE